MEGILNSQMTVPLSQVAALLALSTIAVFLGRYRIALIVIYLFVFFWVYLVAPPPDFARSLYEVDVGPAALYYGFGFLVVVLTMIGLLRGDD